ncbi:glycosyltransferase family 2 protein [Mucilaginibacter calamicampi]|uniref:Glycosyltransferase family 2 protein n=1 Tax=Mucilaginibacter calamicampi TaxID=1302352 RepID=A0ABW2YVR1_9SPHI
MSKLFSVIIPTYNRAEQIRNNLDHLANQTFKNFEVWVCDDGSEDDTKNIVDSYKESLDINYLWFENWGGPARPRNEGIKRCTGKWICFLDSDDWWYPEKLEQVSKYVDSYDLIYHQLDIISTKNTGKKVSEPLQENVLTDLLVNGNRLANSSVCVKKSILDAVGQLSEDKDLIAMEDYDLWIRVASITKQFKFIEQSLGAYNWGDGSNISHISLERIRKEQIIFNKHILLLNDDDQKEAKRILDYKIGRYYSVLGMYAESVSCLKNAFLSRSFKMKLKATIFFTQSYLSFLFKGG